MNVFPDPVPDLRDASRSGVYALDAARRPALEAAARDTDSRMHVIDLTDAHDKDALLRRFAEALHFPDWFGHNWDALADCLYDLAWLEPAAARVLALWGLTPALREPLLEICEEACTRWRARGMAIWVVVTEDAA